MIVKNEENRYLKKVLEALRHYIDEAVIIDDGSTDQTPAKGLPQNHGYSPRVRRFNCIA